jgi:nucleoside-diphosphate-sugar epimerase
VWNTPDTTQFEALGKNASPATVYSASKTYAEQSSWAWVKEHKPLWDFVTILPPLIWGPYIHQVRQAKTRNKKETCVLIVRLYLYDIHQPAKPHFGSSPGLLLDNILNHPDTSGTYAGDCADVRDTADFHVLALENPDAGGERVLIGPGGWFPESLGCPVARRVQFLLGESSCTHRVAWYA